MSDMRQIEIKFSIVVSLAALEYTAEKMRSVGAIDVSIHDSPTSEWIRLIKARCTPAVEEFIIRVGTSDDRVRMPGDPEQMPPRPWLYADSMVSTDTNAAN